MGYVFVTTNVSEDEPNGPTSFEDEAFDVAKYPFLRNELVIPTAPLSHEGLPVLYTVNRSLNEVVNGLVQCGHRVLSRTVSPHVSVRGTEVLVTLCRS